MMAGLWTVLARDVWSPIWPNLAASAVTTVPVLAWHHARMRRHFTTEVQALRAALAAHVPTHHRDRLEGL